MRWRWQSGIVLFTLFIASGAGAAPCTTANADCTEWIKIDGGPSRVLVYRTYSLEGKNDAISRALIMVHGQGRDANNYFRHAFGAAFLAQSLENTVIIAPRFASNREGNCRDTLSENELNWDCAQSPEGWRVGGHAVDNGKISSFDVIDEIVAKLALKDAFDANDANDVRYKRLALRRGQYETTIPRLLDQVQEQYQDYKDIDIAMKKFPRRRDLEEVCRDWKKAHEMVDSVRGAFNDATAEKTDNRTA